MKTEIATCVTNSPPNRMSYLTYSYRFVWPACKTQKDKDDVTMTSGAKASAEQAEIVVCRIKFKLSQSYTLNYVRKEEERIQHTSIREGTN